MTRAKSSASDKRTESKPPSHALVKDRPDGNFFDGGKTEVDKMKRLIVSAVSSILYYRGFYPEEDYIVRFQDGYRIHVVSHNSMNPLIRQIVAVLKTVFEEVEHKAVKNIMVAFQEKEDPDSPIVEYYKFRLTYDLQNNDDGGKFGKEAVVLLQSVKEMAQAMRIYNRKVYLSFKVVLDKQDNQSLTGFQDVTEKDFLQDDDIEETYSGKVRLGSSALRMKCFINPSNKIS